MQCRTALRRSVCHSRHAYSPGAALLSTFTTTLSGQTQSVSRSTGKGTTQQHLDGGRRQERCSCTSSSLRRSAKEEGQYKDNSNHGLEERGSTDELLASASLDQTRGPRGWGAHGEHAGGKEHSTVRELGTESSLQQGNDALIDDGEGAAMRAARAETEVEYVSEVTEDPAENTTTGVPDAQPTLPWKEHMAGLRHQAIASSQSRLPESSEELSKMKGRFDYEGIALPPKASSAEQPMPPPWKCGRNSVYKRPPRALLAEEIGRFAAYCEPSVGERKAREEVVRQISSIARRSVPRGGVTFEVYGSEKTGLSFPTSDIDFRLSITDTRNGEEWQSDDVARWLPTIRKNLQLVSPYGSVPKPIFSSVEIRRNGRHRLLCAQHRATGIDIQITTAKSTRLQQDLIQTYLERIPTLRPLYHLLRTTLSIRGLTEVFNGGLGSYGTFILLLAALTRRGQSTPPESDHVATHLLSVLDFLTKALDTTKHGLTLNPPKTFLKHDWSSPSLPRHTLVDGQKSKQAQQNHQFVQSALARDDPVRAGQWYIGTLHPLQPYLLTLQDPADPRNDLGRRGHAIKHILATLKLLHQNLQRDLASLGRGGEEAGTPGYAARRDMVRKGTTLLGPLLGRCHEVFATKRARIDGYGKWYLQRSKRVAESGGARPKPRFFRPLEGKVRPGHEETPAWAVQGTEVFRPRSNFHRGARGGDG